MVTFCFNKLTYNVYENLMRFCIKLKYNIFKYSSPSAKRIQIKLRNVLHLLTSCTQHYNIERKCFVYFCGNFQFQDIYKHDIYQFYNVSMLLYTCNPPPQFSIRQYTKVMSLLLRLKFLHVYTNGSQINCMRQNFKDHQCSNIRQRYLLV